MSDEASESTASTPKEKKKPELKPFFVPESVYYQTLKDITETDSYTARMKVCKGKQPSALCHSDRDETFSSCKAALSPSHIITAVKQAYDDRNFRAVYKAIEIGFSVHSHLLTVELIEYLLLTIEIDPAIPNREEFFLKAMRLLPHEIDVEQLAKNFHLLEKKRGKKRDSDSDNVDNES